MAKLDRSKYRASSSEELHQETERVKELTTSTRGSFIKIEAGTNKLRLFPAPLKAKSSLFCFPQVTSFLPFLVDEVNDKGEKTGKQVIKRRPIFNAKVHGDLSWDLVEEYIGACTSYFKSTEKDSKKVLEKLKPITDFKKGIKPSSSWIAYAYKLIGDKKQYGRVQITEGVHKQMDALCLRDGDSKKPIVVDLFSHPDDGKMIQWYSDPYNEDLKSRNKITILFEQSCPLTDEELEMLEGWDSLESLYKNSYKKSDFKKQLEGLQLFDEQNKIGVFDSPAFQSRIDSCREEFEEKYGPLDEDEDDNNSSSDTKTESTSSTKSTKSSSKEETSTIPVLLESMDKKTLLSVIEKLELDVDVKVTTPPSKIRQIIKDAMIEVYELEGDDEEINESIVNIITDSLENEEGNQDDNEDNSSEEYNSDESSDYEGGETENSSFEEEKQEEKPVSKRSSLMSKYQKKK